MGHKSIAVIAGLPRTAVVSLEDRTPGDINQGYQLSQSTLPGILLLLKLESHTGGSLSPGLTGTAGHLD